MCPKLLTMFLQLLEQFFSFWGSHSTTMRLANSCAKTRRAIKPSSLMKLVNVQIKKAAIRNLANMLVASGR